jgi:hypothetical protein
VGVEAKVVEDDIEDSDVGARKFYDLLKDANKSLHENTKHSKFGAIVRMYI